jgi:superfamily II DNA or RNA helicase
MANRVCVLPSGHLMLEGEGELSPAEKSLCTAFSQGQGSGLFALAIYKSEQSLAPCCSYWREFGRMYLSALCHSAVPESGDPGEQPLPPEAELGMMVLRLPSMKGAEYVGKDTLAAAWQALDSWVRSEVSDHPGGLGGFLSERAPLWHRLGRVSFHLAENKRDPQKPFAFMATYSRKLSGDGKRVQYLPLKQALKEYAWPENKAALLKLLSPVQRAAGASELVDRLVKTGQVYQALAWEPRQAYEFLKQVEQIESGGVLVHLPDWWKKRKKARVSVQIGGREKGQLSAQSLMDFDVSVSLGGETLGEEDFKELMASGEEGLVLFRGQWVEVDQGKLQEALAHWEQIAGDYPDGVSFIEGMRMLAGASGMPGGDLGDEGGDAEWSFINAGEWLAGILGKLRNPDELAQACKRDGLKATLRPYQELGATWLDFTTTLGLGACLADDMGLGKTIQVIAHLLECRRRPGKHISLLILPTSLLANWTSELDKFAPNLRYKVAHLSSCSPEELEGLAKDPVAGLEGVDLLLTSYGLSRRQEWLQKVGWDLVILDEAQAIKNTGSQQARAIKKLKAKARVALTGTPVENRLSDLWSLFDFLNPGLLGSSTDFKGFVKRLESRVPTSYAPLRQLVQPYILRRLKTDRSIISDLPDKTEITAHCSLSKRQAFLYQNLVGELEEALLDSTDPDPMKRRGLVLAYLMRFKQLCNHPDHLLGSGGYPPEDSGKFGRLREICEEIAAKQEKVLVFTQFKEISGPLADFLASLFGVPGLALHGGTSVKSRKEMVSAFQREDGPPFFVLSLKAGGVGLNLTAASHVIHFDRWWNPAVENQATDRAFRIGQKRNVLVHKFVTQGTVEEKIDAMIESKKQLAGEVLEGGGEQTLTEMTDEELIRMVSLDINRATV